jgi:serine/threonine protein kinase
VNNNTGSRFRVVGQLGGGALSEVYVCRLRGLAGLQSELVVVKRLVARGAADPVFVRMFLHGMRAVGGLRHPNIVQVIEAGVDGSVPYVARDYVKGPTLAAVTERAHEKGEIHYGHFASIMAGICRGLDHAHGAVDEHGAPLGIVHSDLKPANMVVSLQGVPKLIDFGMATSQWLLSDAQGAVLAGKLRYMAPEQIWRKRVDRRADVYALGVTLFELTTGRNPFATRADREGEVVDRIMTGTFARPSQIVPGYPPELEAIVLSAMERDIQKRCPSAGQLGDRLQAFATGGEQPSGPGALALWLRRLFRGRSWQSTSYVFLTTRTLDLTRNPGRVPYLPRWAAAGNPPSPDAKTRNPGRVPYLPRWAAAGNPPSPDAMSRRPAAGHRGRWKWAAVAAAAVVAGLTVWALAARAPGVAVTAPPPRPPIDRPWVTPLAPGGLASESEHRPPLEPATTGQDHEGDEAYPLVRRTPPRARISGNLPRNKAADRDRTPEPTADSPGLVAGIPAIAAPQTPPPRPPAPAAGPTPPAPSPPAAAEQSVPIPSLPRVVVTEDAERLARALAQVESSATRLAGVSPDFTRGVTARLRRSIRPRTPIYPVAMYYFLVREAAQGRDKMTAAANLAVAQASGLLGRSPDADAP